jgi:hypothetical protein
MSEQCVLSGTDFQHRYILHIYLSVAFLFSGSCSFFTGDPEPVYEAAIRHYLERMEPLPGYIILSVEGNGAPETLLKKLDDLDTELRPKSGTGSTQGQFDPGQRSVLHLSVSRLQRRGLNTARVTVSSHTIHDGFMDAHGIEYRLKRENGIWVVAAEGPEWMT